MENDDYKQDVKKYKDVIKMSFSGADICECITVFDHCFTVFCKSSTNENKPWKINHSRLCQTETLLSNPNNPSSKCHFGDNMIPTGII